MSDADETLYAHDDSATGVAATMAAPETADGETRVIAASDAVTPLAWSPEEPQDDVVPFPDTAAVEVDADQAWSWTVVALALTAASLAVVSVSVLPAHAHDAQGSQTSTAAAPTRGALIEITEPPSTVAAPPVTVTEAPPTVTQTVLAPGPAVIPTPSPRTGVDTMQSDPAAFQRGIANAPPSDPMPSAALVLDDGYEACNQIAAGQPRMTIEDALAAEHGLDFGSAVWIWIQASRKLCPNY
jgi:hypothetical protein